MRRLLSGCLLALGCGSQPASTAVADPTLAEQDGTAGDIPPAPNDQPPFEDACDALMHTANQSLRPFSYLRIALGSDEAIAERLAEARVYRARVAALELDDDKLESYRVRWAAGLERLATALELIHRAGETDDLTDMSADVAASGAAMEALIGEINGYCANR